MNTRIDRIARGQSWLGGFALSPSLEHAKESSSSGSGDDDNDDASGLKYDDEITTS